MNTSDADKTITFDFVSEMYAIKNLPITKINLLTEVFKQVGLSMLKPEIQPGHAFLDCYIMVAPETLPEFEKKLRQVCRTKEA